MNNIVEIRSLYKSFGKNYVFKNLNLNINKNSFTTIYGPSGCGKSTLLNIIGLIEKYDSGQLIINGIKAPKPNSRKATLYKRKMLSYIFQNFGLISNTSINNNLNIGIRYVKKNKKTLHQLKLNALKRVGIDYKLRTKVYQLSGGEQQRIAIARAILKPSQIILADEPTGSLDFKNKQAILNLLLSLKKTGKTIIVVSHDPYLKEYSDRVINL